MLATKFVLGACPTSFLAVILAAPALAEANECFSLKDPVNTATSWESISSLEADHEKIWIDANLELPRSDHRVLIYLYDGFSGSRSSIVAWRNAGTRWKVKRVDWYGRYTSPDFVLSDDRSRRLESFLASRCLSSDPTKVEFNRIPPPDAGGYHMEIMTPGFQRSQTRFQRADGTIEMIADLLFRSLTEKQED